ncbi:MAG: hypothetical protein ACI8X5_000029 [Planctomycetota bacterium]|jgi:hypothetical protein
MLLVVILGTIGLVLEMGMMRVTRHRMQAAADNTALEVLRERDFNPDPALLVDASDRDHGRRERNRHMASWMFADQNSAGGFQATYEGESEGGAGPHVKMHSTVSGANAMNAGLVVDEVSHSIPILRTNYSGQPGSGAAINHKSGDIVAGQFTGHDPESSVGYGDNPIFRESAGYDRVDFQASEPGEAPFADAVVVRLRRTKPFGHEASSPWNDDVANVSSTGYTMPLIFALGSTFKGADPASGNSVRHHGIPLRATGIAQSRPAVRVGVGSDEPGAPAEWRVGVAPFVFRFSFWLSDVTFTEDSTGEISAVLRLRPPTYHVVSPDHDSFVSAYLRGKVASQVGDLVEGDELVQDLDEFGEDRNLLPSYWAAEESYIPLYDFDSGGKHRICGFGRVRIELAEETGAGNLAGDIFIRFTKLRNEQSPGKPWIAPRNACASFDGTQPATLLAGSGTTSWDELIELLYFQDPEDEHATYLFESRVYAPAHVR